MKIQNINVENFKRCNKDDYDRARFLIGNWIISVIWYKKQTVYDFENQKLDIYQTCISKGKCETEQEKTESIKDCINEFYEYINEMIKGLE